MEIYNIGLKGINTDIADFADTVVLLRYDTVGLQLKGKIMKWKRMPNILFVAGLIFQALSNARG